MPSTIDVDSIPDFQKNALADICLLYTSINDYAAAHNKHAFVTNMFSFGCIHPDYEDWKQELDRLAAANMRGVKIHPAYQQTDLDDPKYLRILERAGTLGLIVVCLLYTS